ncbi:hypothetical protein BSKO_05547 [Bryopsis sp. KO-2023]|nr:hypothetical protein BSKO_05547 [Bryopsis sp. KO-2023]
MSGVKDERVAASNFYKEIGVDAAPVVSANKSPMLAYVTGTVSTTAESTVDKAALIDDVRQALYASKICSYAQGMAIIKAKSLEQD